MDTRTKIISPEDARILFADGNWLVVAGYFDPLTISAAERLHRFAEPGLDERVLAVVLDGTETLLSAEDRTLLVAALRDVDAVVAISDGELQSFVPPEPRIRLVFDEEEERRNTAVFTAVVLRKQRVPVRLGKKDA